MNYRIIGMKFSSSFNDFVGKLVEHIKTTYLFAIEFSLIN